MDELPAQQRHAAKPQRKRASGASHESGTGKAIAVEILTNQTAPPRSFGRPTMASGLVHPEWSEDVIAEGLPISPLDYPAEPGLHTARGQTFEGLHGFLSDCQPDAGGMLFLKPRLQRRGQLFEKLSSVDRLALVGTRGGGALVFQPGALGGESAGSINLDVLANKSRHALLGEKTELEALLARLGRSSRGARGRKST